MITNFQGTKMPKEKAPCKCLSIILLDFVIKAKKKYYPQPLLGECKYDQERIKMENLTDDDLEKVNLMNLIVKQNLIVILIMKQNLIMMNLTNNLLKIIVILITIKT